LVPGFDLGYAGGDFWTSCENNKLQTIVNDESWIRFTVNSAFKDASNS
jgi:hypothetical protein